MKYGFTIGGILGLILGAVVGYVQTEAERNETRMLSATKSTLNELIDNPNVNSISVIGNES